MRERRRNVHGKKEGMGGGRGEYRAGKGQVHEGNGAGDREEGTIFLYSPYSGTHHFNQCDLPFLSPIESTLNCEKAHQVNMDICLAFLARHLLKGALAVVDFSFWGCLV